MRLTLSRKLTALLVCLQVVGAGGLAWLASHHFPADVEEVLRTETLHTSSLLAMRVRAEMRHTAELARILGSAALQNFKDPMDRLKFLQAELAVDTQWVDVAMYSRQGGTGPFGPDWRVILPELQQRLGFQDSDLTGLDRTSPLDLESVAKGDVDLTFGRLTNGQSLLRMAIPFLKGTDGTISHLLVTHTRPEKLGSLFSETLPFTSVLLDRRGMVLGSGDTRGLPQGFLAARTPLFAQASRARAAGGSGQLDFQDGSGEPLLAGFRDVGFAGLMVVTQVPQARAQVARGQFLRVAGLGGGILLALTLALCAGLWGAGETEAEAVSVSVPVSETVAATESVTAAVTASATDSDSDTASVPVPLTDEVTDPNLRHSAFAEEPVLDPEELRQLWQDQAELGVVRELFGLMRRGLSMADFSGKILEIASDLFQINHALFLEFRQGSGTQSTQLFVRAQSGSGGSEAWAGQDLWDRFCEASTEEVKGFLGHQGAHCLLLEAPMDQDGEGPGGGSADLEEEIDVDTGELPLAHRIVSAFYGSAPGRPQVLLIPLVIRGQLFGCLAFYGSPEHLAGRHEVFLSASRFGEAVSTLLEYRFMLAWGQEAETEIQHREAA